MKAQRPGFKTRVYAVTKLQFLISQEHYLHWGIVLRTKYREYTAQRLEHRAQEMFLSLSVIRNLFCIPTRHMGHPLTPPNHRNHFNLSLLPIFSVTLNDTFSHLMLFNIRIYFTSASVLFTFHPCTRLSSYF